MSNESVQPVKLYAQIPCGIEQEPSYPPLSGKSSSTSSSLAESSEHPVGNKDTGSSSTSNSGHNLQQVPISTDKEPKHVKLLRPRWVYIRDLFFSLQTT